MRDCDSVQDKLSAYLDGELPPAVRDQVSAHLASCDACRREWQRLASLWDALAHLPEPAPVDLTEAVLARLPRRRASLWQGGLALAAAVLLGIFLGGKLGSDLHQALPVAEPASQMAHLEAFDDFPEGSLGTMLVTYEPGNG